MGYIQDYRTFYSISDDVDDYDLSWKIYNEKPEYAAAGVDFNTFSDNIGAERDRFDISSFTKGLKSGALGLAATVPAVISLGANILGADEIARDFAESAQNLQEKGAQYRPRTEFKELFTDPTVAGVFDQIFFQLGNVGPSMLLGGVGGIVGRTAGKAIAGQVTKGLVKNLLTKRAGKILATDAGKKLITSKGLSAARKQALLTSGAQIGTGIGVMGAVSPMEVAQNYLEDVERHGVEDTSPIKSIITGTVAGSLELLGGHFRLLNRILGNKVATKAVSNAARGKWSQVGRVLKEAATIGGQEALQELGQEELSLLNVLWTSDEIERSNLDYWSEENMLRRGESAFAGLVAGVIPGAGSGVVAEIKRSGFDPDTIESKVKEALGDEGVSEEIGDDPIIGELGTPPDGPLRTATDRQAYINLQEALSKFEETPEAVTEPIQETVPPEPIQPEVLPEDVPAEIPTQRTTEEISVEDAEPVLIQRNQSGSIIYLEFDNRLGRSPTVEEIKKYANDNGFSIEAIRQKGILDNVRDTSRFRINVFDKDSRASKTEASTLSNLFSDTNFQTLASKFGKANDISDQAAQPEQDVAVEREENLKSIISPEPQKAATHPVIKELSAAKALGLDKRTEVDQQAEVMPEVEPDAVEEIPQPVQPAQPDLSNITIPDVAIDQEGNQIMEIVDDTPQPLTVQRSAQEAMDDIDSRLAPWKKSKDGISVYDRLLNCLAG